MTQDGQDLNANEENGENVPENSIDSDLAARKKQIIEERDNKLATIEKQFSPAQNTAPQQPVIPEPGSASHAPEPELNKSSSAPPKSVPIDEIEKELTEAFKAAIYSPNASPGNMVPFARVLMKEKAVFLENSIASKTNGDTKMAAEMGSVILNLKRIWESFELAENENRQHMKEAINGRIAEIDEVPVILQHKLAVVRGAMQMLEDRYAVQITNQNTFGGGVDISKYL